MLFEEISGLPVAWCPKTVRQLPKAAVLTGQKSICDPNIAGFNSFEDLGI
jgi:hypothetical protein